MGQTILGHLTLRRRQHRLAPVAMIRVRALEGRVVARERALRFHELAGFKRDMPSLRTKPKGAGRVEEIRLKRVL